MKWRASLVGAFGVCLAAAEARAEAPPFGSDPTGDAAPPVRVKLVVDVPAPVRVESGGLTQRCGGPCTVEVERGMVVVSTDGPPAARQEIWVEGPSRVTFSPGVSGLRTSGLAMLFGGAAVVVAGVVIPLVVCRQDSTVDPTTGRVINPDPCRDISTGVKIGWIAGIGLGLTAGVVGGFLFAGGGPSFKISDAAKVSVGPGGASLDVRF